MATIRHEADARPIRLTHFTPMARECWSWMFFRPVLSLSGLQPTITGEVIDIGAGSTAWEHVKDTPSFQSREAADDWAEQFGFAYDLAEID